ncbi:hypothetical protein IAU59_003491 [Kwoniella sp. CBS 9459]
MTTDSTTTPAVPMSGIESKSKSCNPITPTTTSSPSTSASATTSMTSFKKKTASTERMSALEEELAGLRARLGDRDPKEINKNHIELLHTYNEIKDGTQALIGRYAAMNRKTVGQVHVELNLPLTD